MKNVLKEIIYISSNNIRG